MSDAIRAALEAAGAAVVRVQGYADETTHDAAVAAIAAFLRQMDPVACGDGFTFTGLADAVERAAGAHGWRCPINSPGCTRNCGSYGCGN
jgi:ribosomal protein S5